MKSVVGFFLGLISVSLSGYAQVENIDLLNKLYPSQPLVYLLKEENCDATNEKGVLQVSKHVKEKFIILNDAGKSYSSRSVYTNQFIEIKNIKAFNYIPNGKKYSKIQVDNVKLSDASSENFYDGTKKITVQFPFSEPGCILEIEYDEVYKEPRFFGSFYISEYYPVIKANCTLKYANTVSVNVKGFNTDSIKSKFTEKQTKNDMIKTWSFDTIPPLKPERNSPDYKSLASYYLFNIKDYQSNATTVPLVGSVDNLYKWYLDLVKNLNKSPSPQLQHITDSLTANCKTDLEKLKNIYYWVQDKIAYIAYEDGLGGYIPREADVICKRRFGDCKDMASILTAMGRYAKLPIYLTWIGTRDIPYQFTEVPAPMAANHMIATYLTKDTCLFLDATGKHQDLGTHTSMIQGKEAIIGLSEDKYIIQKVPILPSQRSYFLDSVTIHLNKNTVVGKGIVNADGYSKIYLQNRISSKPYKEQFEFLSSYLRKGNNKFQLDTFAIVEESRDKPLVLNYSFKIPSYITETSNELFINMNFDKDFMDDFTVKDRKTPIEFNYEFRNILIVTLMIDKNYKSKHLPANLSYDSNMFAYKANYSQTENTIKFVSQINLAAMLIDKSSFSKWNDFVKEQNKNKNKTVYLNKIQ